MDSNRKPLGFWVGISLLGIGLLLVLGLLLGAAPLLGQFPSVLSIPPASATPTDVPPTMTPEPIVPTPTPARTSARATAAASPTITQTPARPTATATPYPTPRASLQPLSPPSTSWWNRPRWGVGVVSKPISSYNIDSLQLGWYLDWRVRSTPPRPGGIEYVQMVRLYEGVLRPDTAAIAAAARANPGSLWLIGNEPDVKWQDNVEPAAYAQLYHEAYSAIKEADPTAQVAIGGVTQPTPLRMRYLDMVLAEYQGQFGTDMPMDVWNVHNFILREERGSWGVEIPPGLPDDQGALYEIDDSDNLAIFRQQIIDFRRWMVARGYGNYPLVISEYGILMPEDYGFSPERVAAFMRGTFDFFLTATDPALGYSEDGYRLVQRWCWYSLDAPDPIYPTGNLFDLETGQMTAVGGAWAEYVENKLSRP